eukprot:6172394-Pleurochrysis_carterae.AAC.2
MKDNGKTGHGQKIHLLGLAVHLCSHDRPRAAPRASARMYLSTSDTCSSLLQRSCNGNSGNARETT